MTHTNEQVAAFVEEAWSKMYDLGKARLLTTLEALLGDNRDGKDKPFRDRLADQAVGRLVTYALQDMERTMKETLSRHFPAITSRMLDEARSRRETRQDVENIAELDWRIDDLKKRLRTLENERKTNQDRVLKQCAFEAMAKADAAKVSEALQVLKS